MNRPEVVFFGSGPVAAKSLELLLANFEVVAVVTKPKPEHHRGSFPVIDLAKKHHLPTYTVSNKQELSELIAQKPFTTGLAILIDFGIIVRQDVIDYFPKGIINSHFSLLPEWRGADPITFSILSGQKKTGVSLMLIDEGMDTGLLIRQKSLQIKPEATTPSLIEELIHLSQEMLSENIPLYLSGRLKPHRQPHPDRATYSRKLTKEDGILDFTKPAEQLEREVRAFIEWPKSRTTLASIDVVITSSEVQKLSVESTPGKLLIEKKKLFVGTGRDWLEIKRLKPASKSEMSTESFIAGYGNKLQA